MVTRAQPAGIVCVFLCVQTERQSERDEACEPTLTTLTRVLTSAGVTTRPKANGGHCGNMNPAGREGLVQRHRRPAGAATGSAVGGGVAGAAGAAAGGDGAEASAGGDQDAGEARGEGEFDEVCLCAEEG
jgi:hypothetical protein